MEFFSSSFDDLRYYFSISIGRTINTHRIEIMYLAQKLTNTIEPHRAKETIGKIIKFIISEYYKNLELTEEQYSEVSKIVFKGLVDEYMDLDFMWNDKLNHEALNKEQFDTGFYHLLSHRIASNQRSTR